MGITETLLRASGKTCEFGRSVRAVPQFVGQRMDRPKANQQGLLDRKGASEVLPPPFPADKAALTLEWVGVGWGWLSH